MKLATLKSEKRDGTLIVVSKDLTRAVKALDIATTLQKALEDWRHTAPKLEMVYKQLCAGTVPDSFQFDPRMVLSPLPRAYQWLDASAYLPHIERVRKSRGQDVPENVHTDVIMYQGGSDHFLAPRQDIPYDCAEDWGADFEAEIAVVTDDVPIGVSVDDAVHHIKLVMLCNDVSLRNLAKTELAKGFGFVQAKPPSSFAPVAVSVHE